MANLGHRQVNKILPVGRAVDKPEFAGGVPHIAGIQISFADNAKQMMNLIESEDRGVSLRSALELLSAAYALHPAFGEARIVEFGAALRPAYPDNLPRIAIDGQRISVNGLYRHGFLLAPALAELTLRYVERGEIDNEVMRCA